MHYALIGDFNAKPACLPDFVNPDEDFLNIMNINNDDDAVNYFFIIMF